MWKNGRGTRGIFKVCNSDFWYLLGVDFLHQILKHIMVSFRVPNYHDLIER